MSNRKPMFRLYKQAEENGVYSKELIAVCSSLRSLKSALGAGILTGIFSYEPKTERETDVLEPDEQKRRLYEVWQDYVDRNEDYVPVSLLRRIRNALVEIEWAERFAKTVDSPNTLDEHGNLKCYTCIYQEDCHNNRSLMAACMTRHFEGFAKDTCMGCRYYAFRFPYASMFPCNDCARAHRTDHFELG